jgi:hypothetical protein
MPEESKRSTDEVFSRLGHTHPEFEKIGIHHGTPPSLDKIKDHPGSIFVAAPDIESWVEMAPNPGSKTSVLTAEFLDAVDLAHADLVILDDHICLAVAAKIQGADRVELYRAARRAVAEGWKS